MPVLEHECSSCGGSGVYQGMCEGKDEAVVCLGCNGSGKAKFTYKEFTGRKTKRGVKKVRWSRGSFIATGVGGRGQHITYEEFLAGKLPPKKE